VREGVREGVSARVRGESKKTHITSHHITTALAAGCWRLTYRALSLTWGQGVLIRRATAGSGEGTHHYQGPGECWKGILEYEKGARIIFRPEDNPYGGRTIRLCRLKTRRKACFLYLNAFLSPE